MPADNPAFARRSDAAVALGQQDDPAVFSGQCRNELGRPVGAAVVDDDQLPMVVHLGEDRFDGPTQECRAVAGGQYHRNQYGFADALVANPFGDRLHQGAQFLFPVATVDHVEAGLQQLLGADEGAPGRLGVVPEEPGLCPEPVEIAGQRGVDGGQIAPGRLRLVPTLVEAELQLFSGGVQVAPGHLRLDCVEVDQTFELVEAQQLPGPGDQGVATAARLGEVVEGAQLLFGQAHHLPHPHLCSPNRSDVTVHPPDRRRPPADQLVTEG